MPQVVQSNILQADIAADVDPRPAQVLVRLIRLGPGNDKSSNSWDGFQYLDCRVGKVDGSRLVGFGIGQPDKSAGPVDMRPFDCRHLARAGAGEQGQTQPCRSMGTDLLVALGALYGFGGLPNLFLGKEPLARPLAVHFDSPARVAHRGPQP